MARKGIVANLGQFRLRLRNYTKGVKSDYTQMLENICYYITEKTLARTPVQTGHTVANYQWTRGLSVGGTVDFAGPATPGTNAMALGSEPNRDEAEAHAWNSFRAIPWHQMFGKQITLVNNSEAFAGLEEGRLPNRDGLTPRSPQGMVGITMMEVRAGLATGQFKPRGRRR